jgi:hypothetical protein
MTVRLGEAIMSKFWQLLVAVRHALVSCPM